MKHALYWTIIACFVLAGALDIKAGATKEGAIALLFATANGLIFLWR